MKLFVSHETRLKKLYAPFCLLWNVGISLTITYPETTFTAFINHFPVAGAVPHMHNLRAFLVSWPFSRFSPGKCPKQEAWWRKSALPMAARSQGWGRSSGNTHAPRHPPFWPGPPLMHFQQWTPRWVDSLGSVIQSPLWLLDTVG